MAVAIEKRREARVETDERAFVQMMNPFSPDRLPVSILNHSKSGIGIGSATFLPRGAEVWVFRGKAQLIGRIRYCVPANEAFRAGIEVSRNIEGAHPREAQ